MTLGTGTVVRVIGQREVDAKLLAAAPRILAENRLMVTQMLEQVKAEILPGTPLGPGHFGYHLRDSYKVQIAGGGGIRTSGKLLAPPQGYWREFGTRGGHRARKGGLRRVQAYMQAVGGGGGEKAGLFASKALAGVRKLIRLYYGKAQWWRL